MKRFFQAARSWTMTAVVGASAVGAYAEGLAPTLSGVGGAGIVDGLALASHLDPLTPDQVRNTEFKPAAYSIDAQPRLSMPAVDRSRTLVAADLFPNSKAIVPLLVSDMNPNSTSFDRPMSARSVGARPSLPFVNPQSRRLSR